MKIKNWFILIFLSAGVLFGQDLKISVKYITESHIYIDAGKDAGINVNDTLLVKYNESVLGKLIVDYVSDYSASCRFEGDKSKLRVGLPVFMIQKKKAGLAIKKKPAKIKRTASLKKVQNKKKKRKTTDIRGSIRLIGYYWNDFNTSGLNFFQPGIHFDFKARSLFNGQWNFVAKMRVRKNYRDRVINSSIPKREWRNRVYQFYLEHDVPQSSWIFKAGRILENDLTGIGYLDGIIVGARALRHSSVGVIAGTRPEWKYSDPTIKMKKYGAFFSYQTDIRAESKFKSTIAINGEYFGSVVSREYISFYNFYNKGNKIYSYLFGELDVNRDWRKEKSGSSLGLSNFYASIQYNWKKWLKGGLSIDQRQNYWTYEYRTLADSLFDNVTRRGMRLNLSSQLPYNYNINVNAGVNKRESNTQPTWSGGLSISNYNWLNRRLRFLVNTFYFHNPLMDGATVNFSLGKNIFSNAYVNTSVRYYGYTNNSVTSSNFLFSISTDFYLMHKFNISNWIEYVTGDDENGVRTWIELGYFF